MNRYSFMLEPLFFNNCTVLHVLDCVHPGQHRPMVRLCKKRLTRPWGYYHPSHPHLPSLIFSPPLGTIWDIHSTKPLPSTNNPFPIPLHLYIATLSVLFLSVCSFLPNRPSYCSSIPLSPPIRAALSSLPTGDAWPPRDRPLGASVGIGPRCSQYLGRC